MNFTSAIGKQEIVSSSERDVKSPAIPRRKTSGFYRSMPGLTQRRLESAPKTTPLLSDEGSGVVAFANGNHLPAPSLTKEGSQVHA